MKKYLKNPLIILIVCVAIYFSYTRISYYHITGSVDAEKISSIAISKKDPSVCSKIRMGFDLMPMNTTSGLQDQCYTQTAKGLRDQTICERVSATYRGNCYLDMASLLGDESICELSSYQGMCYGWVASQKKDVKICDKVSDEPSRNRCYLELNQAIGDISICENKIHTTKDKDHCYYAVLLSFFQRGKQLTPTEKQICEKVVSKDIYYECLRYYTDSTAKNR